MNIIARAYKWFKRFSELPQRMIRIQEALGRIERRQIFPCSADIGNSEFKVFSQWGEDGLIQYLLHEVKVDRKIFVEFGVENYTESNTRFLLINNLWSGLVIDGGAENIDFIKNDPVYWACNLKATQAFITRENINELITSNGIKGDIGLLSVDIDGNDYWVWEAITCISPRIVICEYNSLFGPVAKVSTPYRPDFVREKAHFSKVYYGASIAALSELGAKKGYSLVASNSAGNNLFFVRNDVLGVCRVVTPAEAYQKAQFREYHDEHGVPTFYDFETRLDMIKQLDVYDIDAGALKKIIEI
jgi:hypothetical protein